MSRPFSFLLFSSFFDFAFAGNVSCLLPHSDHSGFRVASVGVGFLSYLNTSFLTLDSALRYVLDVVAHTQELLETRVHGISFPGIKALIDLEEISVGY